MVPYLVVGSSSSSLYYYRGCGDDSLFVVEDGTTRLQSAQRSHKLGVVFDQLPRGNVARSNAKPTGTDAFIVKVPKHRTADFLLLGQFLGRFERVLEV